MNRRNLLKTFLAAPAIIRSGVLMPVVPLVATLDALALDPVFDLAHGADRTVLFRANRAWIVGPDGRKIYDTATDIVRVDYIDLRRGQQSAVLRLPKQSSQVYDLWGAAISEKAGRA